MDELEKRVARLEKTVERALDLMGRLTGSGTSFELELLKQYLAGRLEQAPDEASARCAALRALAAGNTVPSSR